MIHVTHDQAEALAVGDRLALFDQGRLVAVGEPQSLYDRPPTRFVGGFLGSPPMNFLEVEVRRADGTMKVGFLGGEALTSEIPDRYAPAREGRLVLGIRPESVRMGKSENAGALAIEANLDRVERSGHESIGVLMTEADLLMVRLPSHAPFEAGERVSAWLALDEATWFEPDTGGRIELQPDRAAGRLKPDRPENTGVVPETPEFT